MRTKVFNPQIFLESLCYFAFGGVLLYLVRSGKYLSYVTPRMEPYLYFTAIVMGIWAILSLGRLFRPQHKIRSAHCLVLVIPVLFLLLPHSPLSTADLSTAYTGGSTISQSASNQTNQRASSNQASSAASTPAPAESSANSSAATQTNESSSASAASAPPDTQSATTENTRLSGLDASNKKITVGNDEFYAWIVELYTNMDQYEGYTISITGFVFNDPEYLAEDEFIPARLAMVCCAADLTPIGLICNYDGASELTADAWVTVEGVIYKGQYQGQDEPQITVTKITNADEVEGYVYPY